MAFNVKEVERQLKARGINAKVAYEWSYDSDGQVDIVGRNLHVQVGASYLMLMENHNDESFTFFPERYSVTKIIQDIQSLKGEGA